MTNDQIELTQPIFISVKKEFQVSYLGSIKGTFLVMECHF